MSGADPGDEAPGPRMMGDAAFDTDLPGEPLTIEVLAEALARHVLPALDEAVRVAEDSRAAIAAEWRGLFARRSQAVVDELASRTAGARAEVELVVDRLRGYAERLRAAQVGLADLRAEAAAAGLVVTGGVVSAPPGRGCDLLPFLERARALYRLAATTELPPHVGHSDLAWLLLAPTATADVGRGVLQHRASGLRARAAALDGGPRAARLGAEADDLARRGAWVSRGTTAVTFPLGVALDLEDGESAVQAGTSQGAGVVAGGLASAGAAAVLAAPSGPGAVVAGVVAFGAGVVAGSAANASVDAGFASAARRGDPAARLAYRCGPGKRRTSPQDTKYGIR